MKVSVQQKNFKKALHLVERIVSRNVSLPILNNILIKTENGRLRISATNLEIGITCFIGAKIDEVGEIAVPARIISDFVNTVNEETIVLTTKNNSLLVNSDSYKTQILGFGTTEYPIIPKIKNDPLCAMPAKMMRSALSVVMDSIAASEVRPELSGMYAQFLKNKIIFAATDSFRLAEKKMDLKHNGNVSVIIPRNTAAELMRISGDLDTDIQVRIGDNQISFSSGDTEIVSRLIDGNYPDYAKVIPEKALSRALISKSELEKNIRLAGLFSSSIADVKISCADGKATIASKNADKGEIQTSAAAVVKNEPFEIALNFNYLLDGLKAIDTDKVVIEFTGSGSPLVLRPDDERKDTVYLVMPLRN